MSGYTVNTFTDGDHRVRVVLDQAPHEPYNDGGCPVLRLSRRGVSHTGYAEYGSDRDGLRMAAEDVLSHFLDVHGDDGLNVFDRYLRAFHGGAAVVLERRGWSTDGYVAYVTDAMRVNAWGCDPGTHTEPEGDEWMAYINGDVFGLITEKRTVTETAVFDDGREVGFDSDETWTEIDSIWGYYGEEYAEQAARDELALTVTASTVVTL